MGWDDRGLEETWMKRDRKGWDDKGSEGMRNIGRDPWDEREGRKAGRLGRGIGRVEKGWKGQK